jgi:hypothetical protein
MSGPKTTHIRPSPQRLHDQLLAPLVPGVERAASDACHEQGETTHADLSAALDRLRAKLRTFQDVGGSRSAMLAAAREAEAALARVRDGIADAPAEAYVQTLLASMREARSSGTENSIGTLRLEAERVLAAAETARSAHREAERLRRTIDGFSGSGGQGSDLKQLDEGLRHAARAEHAAESAAVAALGAGDLALSGVDGGALQALLRQAEQAVVAGKFDEAAGHLAAVRSERVAVMQKAAEVRKRIELRDISAGNIAEALCQRNYDDPHCYLAEGPGGEERPLVLYAQNPAGSAHVRITMTLDGGMRVEVDGVADGEEELCLDVLNTLGRAVAADGDQLEIVDFGRAKLTLERAKQRGGEIEREQRREREGR